jgi:DNA-binding transcriptional MocR family regulator
VASPDAVARCRLHGDCRAEHVLCCVPQEGVLLAHSLLQRGQHVVVTAPGYQSLHSLAEAMGCACVRLVLAAAARAIAHAARPL